MNNGLAIFDGRLLHSYGTSWADVQNNTVFNGFDLLFDFQTCFNMFQCCFRYLNWCTIAAILTYISIRWAETMFNDFAHITWEDIYPRLPQTARKNQIPPETVCEGSGVSSRGMWVRSYRHVKSLLLGKKNMRATEKIWTSPIKS